MFTCSGNHDEFIAIVSEELDPDRIGVIVYASGKASNRWADGTAGVPVLVRQEAEEDDEPYCPICHEVARWRTPLNYVGRF